MVGALLLSLASIACIELWSYGHSLKGPVAYSSIMHKGLACIVTGFLYCSGCTTSLCGGMFLLSWHFFSFAFALSCIHPRRFCKGSFGQKLRSQTVVSVYFKVLSEQCVIALFFFGHLCCCSISASLKLVLAGGNEQL